MDFIEIIEHKRDKKALTLEEIHYFISKYVNNEIPDYQVSSLLMAIYLNGMNIEEITNLTLEMMKSGEIWDLSDIPGIKVDKHSTGGVGDKVSLVLGPLVASCGGKLAKMSGRGLGHTGGTLDKLESIPGFSIYKNYEEFKKQVNDVGMCIIGQDKNIDPADKKLYALRDVTGTVGCIPLIASSIMSKKLASGADSILLDVKYGSGAFMKTIESAKELALTMVNIGKMLNKNVKAEITDMDEPLGLSIGNNLEIKEVIKTLKNDGPKDLTDLCVNGASIMLVQGKVFDSIEKAKEEVIKNLKNGKAFDKFVEFVKAQNGDINYILNPDLFKKAKYVVPIYSSKSGYINRIDALTIGTASMHLGGGRMTLDDEIDMSAGIILNKKIGDKIDKDELLVTLYTDKENIDEIKKNVINAFNIVENKVSLNKKTFLIE